MAAAVWLGPLTVFAVIGGLELLDRTSFALIGLSARAHAAGAWLGGSAAFVLTTILAVVVGGALETFLGPSHLEVLRVVAGSFLIAYAAWILVDRPEEAVQIRTDVRGAFVAAFATIALLELGDTTMIFEIVLVPSFGWVAVLLGGCGGLVCVAAFDVTVGSRLVVRLRPDAVRVFVAGVLLLVGALTVVYGLAPSTFSML